jgi:hypothetical protein
VPAAVVWSVMPARRVVSSLCAFPWAPGMASCWAGVASLLCCAAAFGVIGMTFEAPIAALPVRVRNRGGLGWNLGDGYLGVEAARMVLRSDQVLELRLPASRRQQRTLRLRPRSPGGYDWPDAAWWLARADWSAAPKRLLIMCEDTVRTEDVVRAIDLGAGLGFGRGAIVLESGSIAWDDGPPPIE